MDPKPGSVPEFFRQFERIYVINLRSRADRRAEIDEQLRRVGLGLAHPQVRLFEAVRPADAGGFENIGAHGCFLSHLGVLRDAQGLRNILILEDDLDFVPRVDALLAKVGPGPEAWDFMYPAVELPGHVPGAAPRFDPIDPATAVVTAHFLAVQAAVIGPLADYLAAMLQRPPGDPAGGPMHVDGAYGWFRRTHPALKTWVAVPPLGYQRASRTDIHRVKWWDATPGVREVVALLRRFKRRWRQRE